MTSPPFITDDPHYKRADARLDAILEEAAGSGSTGSRGRILRQVVTILHDEIPHYHWVGIYLVEGQELVLDCFVGKPTPHERIPVGEGICGAAVAEDATIIVDDVKTDSRYIACSLETASEIVVPIRAAGRPVGEIDIDSDTPAAFSTADSAFLERVATALSALFAD